MMILILMLSGHFYSFATILIVVAIFFFYLFKRIHVRISRIEEGFIFLKSGVRERKVSKEDIKCVHGTVGAFCNIHTSHYTMYITIRENKFPYWRVYAIVNEPKYDFYSVFKKMGLKMRIYP